MTDFTPTEEQQQVVQAVRGRGSVMVEAGAGCAKTSTLKLAAPGVRVPALGLAFNRRIADDMQKAVPGNIQVKTMNGLGHSAWGRQLGRGIQLTLDDRKTGRLVTQVMTDRKVKKDEDRWDCIRTLVRQAMASGLVPSSVGMESLVDDTSAGWSACGHEAGLVSIETKEAWELAREVLERGIAEARLGKISFDDQVYCSSMLGGRFPRFPVVLVDEDQDLSPLNIRMLGQALAPGGRIIAVGDRRQAIYAWRGAAGDSAERIRQVSSLAWTDLPLMTTFRCPRVVVERQQGHVPGFRAADSNQTGQFIHWHRPPSIPGDYTESLWPGWAWGDIGAAMPHSRASIAILCRNNAPLLHMAIKLIKAGVGVVMLGRDIGKGLERLVRKLCPEESLPRDAVLAVVEEWRQRECLAAFDHPSRLESINDRADCLVAVAQQVEVKTAGELVGKIKQLFDRESGLVTLSSIHRAKGLEWDLVLHLDPWRIPSRWAKEAAKAGQAVALEQEWNLRYVAETRTRHTLLLADLDDFVEGD